MLGPFARAPWMIAGDANLDAAVDGSDYTLWADHYGMTDLSCGEGDFNGDGVVDGSDYTRWADNYNADGGTPSPEPAALALLAMGGPALIRRHKRG
jgi:MYXO-CTERM domain-containing protein